MATRSAEWNYLFGAVLFRLGEVEKAVLYFGIATRSRRANSQYQTAYESAEALRTRSRAPASSGRVRNEQPTREQYNSVNPLPAKLERNEPLPVRMLGGGIFYSVLILS